MNRRMAIVSGCALVPNRTIRERTSLILHAAISWRRGRKKRKPDGCSTYSAARYAFKL